MTDRPIRIATRGSRLARAQSSAVRDQLAGASPELGFELVIVKTQGDAVTDKPLAQLGSVGVFVAEIRRALLAGEADLAVHSLKDLPTEPVGGLAVGAIPTREDPADVLVSREGMALADLPRGSRIGTSSPRRAAWLRAHAPHCTVVDLRGNVPTRLEAVEEGAVHACVLAAAGLKRLGLFDRATEVLPLDSALPAPGQGALAIEIVAGGPAAALVPALHDEATAAAVTAERACLTELGGGCTLPLGALATPTGDGQLLLRAGMPNAAGEWVQIEVTGAANAPNVAGAMAAAALRDAGITPPA
ncbi:MAG: hydroxymethylbilane synthase [Planctomycetota bacterium]|jgi:hydroxymethylbilane synthase